MVLINMGTSRVFSTCCRMEVEVACRFTTTCQWMRRSTRVDVTLTTPDSFKFATFPCSNHLRHSQCTVDESRCISAAICCMDQPALLSPIILFLLKLSASWKLPPLTMTWYSLLLYVSCETRKNMCDLAEITARILPISENFFPYILFNVHWRAVDFTSFE